MQKQLPATPPRTDRPSEKQVATFDNPGVFPKYLCTIGGTFMLADLATITELSANGRELPVEIFRWILDENWHFKRVGYSNGDNLPIAPLRLHSGGRLKYVLSVSDQFQLFGLREAGRMYDSGMTQVEFGQYVVDDKFIVWAMAERHRTKISQLAEDHSSSK